MSNVDFNNPEALEAELAAVGTEAAKKEATPKKKKPRVIKVSFTATEDIAAGTTVEFDYEIPATARRSGAVAGIPLEDMTVEQLKIEYRNAQSVLYKARKKGTATPAQEERVEKVVAALKKAGVTPGTRATAVAPTASTVAALIKSGQISIDELQALLEG